MRTTRFSTLLLSGHGDIWKGLVEISKNQFVSHLNHKSQNLFGGGKGGQKGKNSTCVVNWFLQS